MRAALLVVLVVGARVAHADDSFEAKATGALRLHRIEGLVWALTATCDAGDDITQRQCRRVRDARVAELAGSTLIIDADRDAFDVGAYNAQKKSVPIQLTACIRCAGVEVDGKTWYVVGNVPGIPPKLDGGKLKTGLLHENARAFNDEAGAKQWSRAVANVHVELVVKLAQKPKWSEGGLNGIALDVLAYRVYTPCDGAIICSSPASGPAEADKKQCTPGVVMTGETTTTPEVESLTAELIDEAMKPVVSAAHECFYTFGVAGKAKLKITVLADGSIGKYEQQGDFENTTTGQCIDRAMQKAKFPRSKKPKTTVLFPITLQTP